MPFRLLCFRAFCGSVGIQLLCDLVEHDCKTGDRRHHAAQHACDEHFAAREICDRFDFRRRGDLTLNDTALEFALLCLLNEVLQHSCRGDRILVTECECVGAVEHIVCTFESELIKSTADTVVLQNDVLNVFLAQFGTQRGILGNSQSAIVEQDNGLCLFDLVRNLAGSLSEHTLL